MLNELRDDIHADNVAAGWWTDLKTGESILATRNRPELLMLVVSELSEADEAFASNAADDKLPEYPGFDVEVADAAIRLFDICGADNVDLSIETGVGDVVNSGEYRDHLMEIINRVSAAMEALRKNRTEAYHQALREALALCMATAATWDFNLFDMIEAKRAFNRNRADHKPENRRAAGGKSF